jgi:hypothetical protein
VDLLAGGESFEERRRLQLDADPGQQPRIARPGRLAEDRDRAGIRLPQPSIISSVVVLPAPLGPRMPKNSPSATSKPTPSTALSSP